MAITLKDGTVLPDFPEGLFDDEYKYGVCFTNSAASPRFYGVITSPVEFTHLPAELLGTPVDYVGNIAEICRCCYYREDSGEWDPIVEDNPMIPLGSSMAIVWSNHDIKTAIAVNEDTFELTVGDEVYFPNSEAPKGGIVIDGVTLPAFPDTGLKYEAVVKLIIYWGSTPTTQFIYLATDTEMIRIPSSIIYGDGTMPEDLSMLCAPDFSGVSYMYVVEGETQDWSKYQDGFMLLLGTYELEDSDLDMTQVSNLEWSNHDIKSATAINEDTMEITVGDEIFWYAGYASDQNKTPAEPEYGKIRRSLVRGITNAVRRKTGKTDKIPPEQLESEIDSIVTADGMPVAEEHAFGALLTGKYIYGTYQKALTLIPNMGFPYMFLRQYNGTPLAYLSTVPFLYGSNAGTLYAKEIGEYCYLVYDFNSDTWAVGCETTTTSGMSMPNDVLWTNHNICNSYSGNVVHAATTPVTAEESVFEYVEVENFYLIKGDTLNTLIAVIQQITGSLASTPSEAEAALKVYAKTH